MEECEMPKDQDAWPPNPIKDTKENGKRLREIHDRWQEKQDRKRNER